MKEKSEFRELLLSLFEDYPGSKIKENELKELLTSDEIESLLSHGFLVREDASKTNANEKLFRLGEHTTDIVLAWRTEELAAKINRLTIIGIVIGGGILAVLVLSLLVQVVQIFF